MCSSDLATIAAMLAIYDVLWSDNQDTSVMVLAKPGEDMHEYYAERAATLIETSGRALRRTRRRKQKQNGGKSH